MKYWSLRLILSHTDRQTPRQYPQKYSDSWLHSKCLLCGLKVGSYSEKHLSALAYEQALPRKGHCSLHGSLRAPFLLSPLCLTGFASQFEGLSRDSCGKWLYKDLNKTLLNASEQWFHDPCNFALTRAIQVNAIKVSIIGSLSSKTNSVDGIYKR